MHHNPMPADQNNSLPSLRGESIVKSLLLLVIYILGALMALGLFGFVTYLLIQ